MIVRRLSLDDSPALHALYQQSPQYFRVISMPMPNLLDIHAELETGLSDPRRELCFLYSLSEDGMLSDGVEGLQDAALGDQPLGSGQLMQSDASRLTARPSSSVVPVNAEPLGYLDLKCDYPNPGDATINLLLISELCQSRRFGSQAVEWLEEHLRGRGCRRVLASVYGHNPRAVRFWERLGYRFAVDARPVLEWYAKALAPDAPSDGPQPLVAAP